MASIANPLAFASTALAGGAELAGSYYSNQAASAQAQRQMDFQREMSNSAHVREVADLRAAGLNPILSAGGTGASSPVGAQAPVSDYGKNIGHSIDTAIAIRGQNKELEAKDATIANTDADTANKEVQKDLLQNQNMSTAQDIKQKEMQNKVLLETLPQAIKKAKAEGDYAELQQIFSLIQKGASAASDVTDSINIMKMLKPFIKGGKIKLNQP